MVNPGERFGRRPALIGALGGALRRGWWLILLIAAWDLYVRAKGFNVIVLPSPWVVALAIAMGAAVLATYLFVRLRLQKAEDQERRGGF